MPAKRPAPRLALLNEQSMSEGQRALLVSLRAGPRGASITPRGPFAAWMHAPELGELAQKLGAYFAMELRSLHACPNSQSFALRVYGARNMSGSPTRQWRQKAASSRRQLKI